MMDVESRLGIADWVMVGTYFVALIATGIVSSMQNRGSVGGYFLAGQNANWVLVGASLFASNIGSGHFVGLAGTAAKTGISIAGFELHAVFTLFALGWYFLPVYRASGVYTMPEYMHKRFGGSRIRVYLAVMSLILYIFTKISADLYSGALFMDQAMPGKSSLYFWVIILVTVAAFFTISGGLTAVMWTDTIQTVIMVMGALILMFLSFEEVGGYEEMKRKFPIALADTTILKSGNHTYKFRDCGRPKQNWFSLMLPHDDGHLPWTGMVFGLTVSAIWYWCTDQVIVQRALAAKNMLHAKMGCVIASYLKVLPMWLIVFPGMISRIIYRNEVACNEAATCMKICKRESGCTDIAYPLLVVKLMPTGIKGLMIAVMMSALISSLTSVFNSTSTIFTIDVWRRLRRRASDVELMVVGRLAVVLCIVISIIWIPVVESASMLFEYIQQMTSYLGSSVCAAFVLAIFWSRATEPGTFWGLMIGTVSGLVRGIWQTMFYDGGSCRLDYKRTKRAGDILIEKVHYLHFGVLNFLFTCLCIILISFLTPAPSYKSYMGKTYFTRNCLVVHEEEEEQDSEPPSFFAKLIGDVPRNELSCGVRAFLWLCGVEHMIHNNKRTKGTKPQGKRTIETVTQPASDVVDTQPLPRKEHEHGDVDATPATPTGSVKSLRTPGTPGVLVVEEEGTITVTRKRSINTSIYEPEKMKYIMHANIGLALLFICAYWAFYSVT